MVAARSCRGIEGVSYPAATWPTRDDVAFATEPYLDRLGFPWLAPKPIALRLNDLIEPNAGAHGFCGPTCRAAAWSLVAAEHTLTGALELAQWAVEQAERERAGAATHDVPAQRPLETPALDAWRRRGDTTTRDELWRSAAWEAAALEPASQGRQDAARDCLARARALLAEAVAGAA